MISFILSFPTLLHSAIIFGTVIMFGALGEILTEKSGNLNLGVPGIMYIGAIASLASTFIYENVYCANAGITPNPVICFCLCIFSSLIGSALAGFIYSFLTITLRTNQNVAGLTLSIFGVGIGNFFGGSLNKLAGGVGQVAVKKTAEIFGTSFLSFGFLAYIAVIIAIALTYFLNNTRQGLSLRAVGESASTADACGINVSKYKYFATIVGAMISGMGGTYFVMSYIKGTWEGQGNLEALGWLSLALVIFATWKPLRTIWGSYLFGVLYWAYFYMPGLTRSSQEIFKMLPYIVTIIVLLIVSFRRKKESQPPANLGLPYFREDR